MKSAFFFILGAVSLMAVAASYLWNWLPKPEDIRGCMVTKMYQVDLCPTSKNYVPLKQISPYLQKAIILTEDSDFYNHKGFDWIAIEKNAREGWEAGVFKRGGSTITQQLAKNMFLSKDRTFIRKGLEALITDRIESTLTKKEILERYLNVVEFGKNIYGVKAAAKYYFKKSPSELNIVESAFLAMVLPNPVKYSQSYYRKELTSFAKRRLTTIIDNMFQYHRINQEEYDAATYQLSYFFQPEPPPEELNAAVEEIPTLEELENAELQEEEEVVQ
ncbi:monofunctional biosynthetic peptidoglycan transglycosylase [Bdellovibrio bacteriovorus]|uniref:Monofunctional biosynthetic peptidoglycan transglycosylase n=1 Tax=Bdellovibrio bacteriovorus TaxID=959 RepID=A0A150WCM4_BDEBC|nr:monofunctional biosynthetic peptidoglycan transglycosylase [Bdellovibrio bacteriovorus]KYG60703.1 monofunctional biosynthetic peptidoglycan transglycosylase [Bdellovibrio bacteriovorus]